MKSAAILTNLSVTPSTTGLGTAASRGGWQSSTFGEDFHLLDRLRELRCSLRLIAFAGGIVG